MSLKLKWIIFNRIENIHRYSSRSSPIFSRPIEPQTSLGRNSRSSDGSLSLSLSVERSSVNKRASFSLHNMLRDHYLSEGVREVGGRFRAGRLALT